ncbi:MAG TPA: hypothetical protein VHH35_06675, partial [Pyrinomonadaceae bacterium]|nr:hypothetical protein [Pyrinomonadaceae bacterium]
MLDPVTPQAVRPPKTENPEPVRKPEPQPAEIAQSVARKNDLEFHSSLSRFRLAGPVTAQTPATPVNNVRTDVVDSIVESFDYTPTSSWQDRLLYVLKEDEDLNLTHDEQMAVIGGLTDRMLNEDYAGELLRTTFVNFDTAELRNVGYDNQQFLSGLIGDAYEAGHISDTDLRQIAEELGAEDTEGLILNFASDPGNLTNYGSARIVEALGRQAESLGYETAAALAFTSSESLIAEHYSSPQAQREAFDLVRGYIERFDEHHERIGFYTDHTGESATTRSQFTLALLNASRLTANGNGYSQSDFDELLTSLGPDLVNETIARAGNITGDAYLNNSLDALGDASQRIASSQSGDDQQKWKINGAIAHTQSQALIRGNLTTAQARMEAFDLLNGQLVGLRDDVDDAAGNYTLLRQPAMLEGMTTLLEGHGAEILNNKLNTGPDYRGQADLVQFFHSSIFSVNTPANVRTRIENVIDSYITRALNDPGANSSLIGSDIGELLGVINVASQRAIQAAPSEQRSEIETFGRSLASKTFGALGGRGLSALITGLGVSTTGPVGIVTTTVGGAIIGRAFDGLFGVNDK